MKLPESKIELAVSDQKYRGATASVKFDVEGKRIMATDGHILAVVPCEPAAEDHSVLLSPDTMKQLRAMSKRSKGKLEIRTNGKIQAVGNGEVASFEPQEAQQFPNVDAVIPKYDEAIATTISIDAALLYTLAQALIPAGDKMYVTLTIRDASSAILVKTKHDGAVGVIAPCRM
jgi:hypothetical protein